MEDNQNNKRGRPKGSSKIGKKRRSMELARKKKSGEVDNVSMEAIGGENEVTGNEKVTEIDAGAGPSGESVCSTTGDVQEEQVLQCGNVLMDIQDTPWLPPELTEHNEVQDIDTNPFGYEDARDIFHDSHRSLPKSDEKTIAVSVYSYFVEVLKWGIDVSLKHTKAIVGRDVTTIRRWRDQFHENRGTFPETASGKYERQFIFSDEDLRDKAIKFIRENACAKGKPNMRVADFRIWVNNTLLPEAHLPPQFPRSISLETARTWLHKLGFSHTDKKKGTYIDGHEREDVKEHRQEFIQKMSQLEADHLPPPRCVDETRIEEEDDERARLIAQGVKKLVLIYHDESAYSANDDERKVWTDGQQGHIRPKGRGSGIMVSDFIDEHNGYLRLTPEEQELAKQQSLNIPNPEARHKFEYGQNREGYWDKVKFMQQMERAVQIATVKYPKEDHTVVWLFDQSSGHTAMADDALNAKRLNLNPGGQQPKMRDTIYNGKRQKLVFDKGPNKGKAKGANQILLERGYTQEHLKEIKLEGCVKELEGHEDFANEKSMLEKYIIQHGHQCYFIPKYHCELNPIERCWGKSKVHTRGHCNYSITGLRQVWRDALETVSVEDMRKYFRRVREYMRAYREGNEGVIAVESAVKTYKSHRRIHHTK